MGDGGIPLVRARRHGTAQHISDGGLVGGHQPGPGAALDGHVADRHAPFHGKLTDRLAGVFDDVAGAAGGADPTDDGEDDVLGADPVMGAAGDRDAHVLGRFLDQRLGGENVLDLGGADAEGQRPEGAMGRGVGIAANDGRARLGEALLGADDMDDPLAGIEKRDIGQAEIGGVLFQGLDLDARIVVDDGLVAVGGRHVVVGHRQARLRAARLAPGQAQAIKGLGAGHLVHQVAVDIQQAGAVGVLADDVAVPNLVEQRQRLGHGVLLYFSAPRDYGGVCAA